MTALEHERLRHAKVIGTANGIRGAIRNGNDPDREARHRAEWPDLWERIDALCEFIRW